VEILFDEILIDKGAATECERRSKYDCRKSDKSDVVFSIMSRHGEIVAFPKRKDWPTKHYKSDGGSESIKSETVSITSELGKLTTKHIKV